ncbi:hypothetical protein RRG08_044377 [Elysia crispata]|uniref:Uncharacterized protein n=1 Tax=Elysia crispata TaxID=231223 RepID=A0AAE0YNT3_9GAST|nr:hypothetical protein RRG08_044377 [Elysia crispata]
MSCWTCSSLEPEQNRNGAEILYLKPPTTVQWSAGHQPGAGAEPEWGRDLVSQATDHSTMSCWTCSSLEPEQKRNGAEIFYLKPPTTVQCPAGHVAAWSRSRTGMGQRSCISSHRPQYNVLLDM